MSPTIRTSRDFSSESAQRVRIEPIPSRFLALWWGCLHGVCAFSVAAAAIALPIKIAALLVLLAHSHWRFPTVVPVLVVDAAGGWSAPAQGLSGLTPGPGCILGRWWIRLDLEGPKRGASWVLLFDQLDARDWEFVQRLVSSADRGIT